MTRQFTKKRNRRYKPINADDSLLPLSALIGVYRRFYPFALV